MNDHGREYRRYYAEEKQVREDVVALLKRDTEEGMEQYTRLLASFAGKEVIMDWPESERLTLYLVNPPVGMDGQPPVDKPPIAAVLDPLTGEEVAPAQQGVFPLWQAVNAEFPARWEWYRDDAVRLIAKFIEGKLVPK